MKPIKKIFIPLAPLKGKFYYKSKIIFSDAFFINDQFRFFGFKNLANQIVLPCSIQVPPSGGQGVFI
jgi:hypothetical protein